MLSHSACTYLSAATACTAVCSGRGAAGSRGSIDPPLFEVPGPPMQFDPPLLTQNKRAQDSENAVHRHKVKVY